MSDTVVQSIRNDPARRLTLLALRDGSCLAISEGLVRFARSATALDDPLGNGVRGAIAIPAAHAPSWDAASGYVGEQTGGAVLLHGGAAVLIKPYAIELYAAPLDALHGRHCLGAIDLRDPAG